MKFPGFILCTIFILSASSAALAHEEGAPFSGAIGEPIGVHHAHIEDEQSFNFSFNDDFRKEKGDKERFAFESSLELAAVWNDDFSFGSEILIPLSDTGNDDDRYALGDIEIWPVKHAFLNEPERIVTGVLSIGLPTGNRTRGFGEDQTKLGALLFMDQAWRNWFFGVNAEFESVVSGPTETEVEFAFALTYSFIEETGDGIAPSKPKQSIVPVLSLELISENILSGLEKENDLVTILPGIQLWNPASGWQAALGVEIPLSSYRNNDYKVHFKLRNHFNWPTSSFD
ncbi:MAG: hypothetical protein IID18_09010 [Nitrospinae bacterium]|nr:hypothetical protein [Nitrospinota bacterium]